MTYNKSEIMTRAWELYRAEMASWNKKSALTQSLNTCPTFSKSLKKSWSLAKAEAGRAFADSCKTIGTKKAAELKAGDVIRINGYGGYSDNQGYGRVKGVSDSTRGDWKVIDFVWVGGSSVQDIGAGHDDVYELVA